MERVSASSRMAGAIFLSLSILAIPIPLKVPLLVVHAALTTAMLSSYRITSVLMDRLSFVREPVEPPCHLGKNVVTDNGDFILSEQVVGDGLFHD